MRRIALALLPLTLFAGAALAEDTSGLNERLDRLERDLNFVQKQVYTGSGGGAVPANAGQLQVRFTQIDEEIRQIRGLIEQTQFQNKQTSDNLKKLQDDVDYRLRAIEQKQQAADAAAAAAASAAATPAPAAAAEPAETESSFNPNATPKEKDTTDSNAAYSKAFKLLSEKKFAEAASAFDAFVKKYPSDPLTANAYYWLGESQYARNDFTRSAESFRKGFEVNPDGPKAPDNLYKLAMSLSQIKRKTEACVVLKQVATKYTESAPRTVTKAEEASTTLQCK